MVTVGNRLGPVVAVVAASLLAGAERPADPPRFEHLFSFRQDDLVTCAAFSRDGRWLATGSEAGTVTVTDTGSRSTVAVKDAESRDNGVQAVRFSRDGRLLLVGGFGRKAGGGEIRVLQTRDYNPVASLDVPWGGGTRVRMIRDLDLSPDNKWLVSADLDNVWVWNLPEKKVAWRLSLRNLAPAYDGGRQVLVGVGAVGPTANLAVYPGAGGEPTTTAAGPGQVVVFDAVTGKVTRVLPAPAREAVVRVVPPAAGTKDLFVLTDAGTVFRMDAESGTVSRRVALKGLYEKAIGKPWAVGSNVEFEVLGGHDTVVVNDRDNTFLVNHRSGELVTLDHGGRVGIRFAPSGKVFALLGGVKNPALAGGADQHAWTVNVYAFHPF